MNVFSINTLCAEEVSALNEQSTDLSRLYMRHNDTCFATRYSYLFIVSKKYVRLCSCNIFLQSYSTIKRLDRLKYLNCTLYNVGLD